MRQDPRAVLESGRFDAEWYRKTYPDVEITGIDPATHYLRYGAAMGRKIRLLPEADKSRLGLGQPEQRPTGPASFGEPENYRKSCYADHVRISWQRNQGRALDATALRTRSYEIRKIFASQASGGTESLDQLLSIMEACRDLTRKQGGNAHLLRYDRAWLMRLARIMALQQLAPDDCINAFTIYRHIDAIGRLEEMSDVHLKVYFDLCIRFNEIGIATRLLGKKKFPADIKNFGIADTLNPAINVEADQTAWLDAFNTVLIESHAEPVLLRQPDDSSDHTPYFDWLATESVEKVLDGPLVSIVVSVWQPDYGLITAVRSLIEQSWSNVEILLIDDCCSDEYQPLIKRVQDLDPRIRCIRQPKNMGTYMARNLAMQHARGEFITFHDADDWCHPRRIERQIAPLLADPALVATTSRTVRVLENLIFSFVGYPNPARLNTSSLMFRLKPVRARNGFFHNVRKGADSEYLTRITLSFGADAYKALPDVLSIVRLGQDSLSRSEFRAGWHHPARQAYRNAYQHWHQKIQDGEASPYLEAGASGGVPAPLRFQIERKPGHRPYYDTIIVGDWREDGGPQNSMFEEIHALKAEGRSVAVCHMEALRFMSIHMRPNSARLQEMINSGFVDEVTLVDPIDTDLVIFRYPPIFQFPTALESGWKIKHALIVANQAPHERDGSDMRYEIHDCIRNARRLLGTDPLWSPQGPLVRDMIAPLVPTELLSPLDFPGIIDPSEWHIDRPPNFERRPRIGRYSRDNALKFPADRETLLQCYPRSDAMDVVIMGGRKTCYGLLKDKSVPSNWRLIKHRGIPTKQFLEEIDFFVYFDHPEILEAFGRSMLEAISSGRVTILPEKFQRVFGDAAIYCRPDEVADTVMRLWSSPQAYLEQSRRAVDHVDRHFSRNGFIRRLQTMFPDI